MQYAIMKLTDDKNVLIDAGELFAFHGALESNDPSSFVIDEEPNEDLCKLHLVYGIYKPQPDEKFPRSEVIRHAKDAVNKWLVHLDKDKCVYLGIEDIVIHDQPLLKKCNCHNSCSKPHKSDDLVFSALLSLPEDVAIGDKSSFALTAFLRYREQMDVLTNMLNRLGLFAFKAEERRYKGELTEDNWKGRIDPKRAYSAAQATN